MSRSAYKGRALWSAPRRGPRRLKAGWLLLLLLVGAAAAWTARDALAKTLPWRAVFTVRTVEVQGETYLSEAEVRAFAGLTKPVDFARVDLAAAEKKLAKQARIERASVERELPRRIVIKIVERKPALLVRAGRLLEADRRGVILPALASGVTPDVPLVSGVKVKDARAGWNGHTRRRPDSHNLVVSDDDHAVADRSGTGAVDQPCRAQHRRPLSRGVDVFLPAEPPSVRPLSALRVVLADLATRGETASRIDLRARRSSRFARFPLRLPPRTAQSLFNRMKQGGVKNDVPDSYLCRTRHRDHEDLRDHRGNGPKRVTSRSSASGSARTRACGAGSS